MGAKEMGAYCDHDIFTWLGRMVCCSRIAPSSARETAPDDDARDGTGAHRTAGAAAWARGVSSSVPQGTLAVLLAMKAVAGSAGHVGTGAGSDDGRGDAGGGGCTQSVVCAMAPTTRRQRSASVSRGSDTVSGRRTRTGGVSGSSEYAVSSSGRSKRKVTKVWGAVPASPCLRR